MRGQLLAACAALEAEQRQRPQGVSAQTIDQAGVMMAIAWAMLQQKLPEVVHAADHPAWRDFSARAERLEAFAAYPTE